MENMSNPYQSPADLPETRRSYSAVRSPAFALIIVSIVALVFGGIGLLTDIGLLASGAVDRLEEMNQSPISKHTQITVRMIWGVTLLFASSFILYGAIQMRNLRKFGTARAAAIVAAIPFIGPCCLLGIPFGIWALVALGKPGVKELFETNSYDWQQGI
jgi:uncharacterized BrkB/YihY/UPF0761 family membrane protein